MLKQLGAAAGIVLLTGSFALASQTASSVQTPAPAKPIPPEAKDVVITAGKTTSKTTANAAKKRQKHRERQARARAKAQANSQTPAKNSIEKDHIK